MLLSGKYPQCQVDYAKYASIDKNLSRFDNNWMNWKGQFEACCRFYLADPEKFRNDPLWTVGNPYVTSEIISLNHNPIQYSNYVTTLPCRMDGRHS